MKAAIYQGNHRFEIKETSIPEPGPDEILVKTRYCSICGTDVHGVLYDVVPPGSGLGHEYSGTVYALGKDVTQWRIRRPGGRRGRRGTTRRHPEHLHPEPKVQLSHHGLGYAAACLQRIRGIHPDEGLDGLTGAATA